MAYVAEDIITGALQLLGVYDPGEPLSANDSTLGLNVANDMLDMWSNESLTCYAYLTQSAPLIPGQQTYTIGPGGDFDMTRPLKISGSPGSCYVQDNNGNNYGVAVINQMQWNVLGNRSNIVTSNFPDTLFYDPQFPLGEMNFFPYPSSSYTAFWTSFLQLTDFALLTTAIDLPPGYAMALKTNLAICLKPYFLDGKLDETVVALAQTSKAAIKRTNARRAVAYFDSAIVSRANILYNPYSDRVGSTTNGAA